MNARHCVSCRGVDPLPGREHTAKGWCVAEPYTPTLRPVPLAPALPPRIDTPAPPTPAKPADGRTEPQGENIE